MPYNPETNELTFSQTDLQIAKRECRKVGMKNSRRRSFTYRIGQRYNTERDLGQEINIRLISDDPHWNDTDLYDNANEWAVLERPIKLSAKGEGIIDIYIYERDDDPDDHGDLVCNAQLVFDKTGLLRVEEDGPVVWKRDENLIY